jgi:hypothetical protein
MNFATKLNNLIIDFLNAWIINLERYWWCIGLIFGICSTLSWLNRENKAGGLFISMAMSALIFQLVFYFAIPFLALHFANSRFSLPTPHLWAFGIGSIVGIATVIFIIRYSSPYIVKLIFAKLGSICLTHKALTIRLNSTTIKKASSSD